MADKIIDIGDLSFSYRDQEENEFAIKGINMSVEKGEFVVIMGHSGAGKSTLCFTLNGLIPNQVKGEMSGSVKIKGRATDEGKVSDFARTSGVVFQDFETQLFSTNVELEVAFGPENFGLDQEEIAERVNECLEIVDLLGLKDREPATLSGGQKQRLAIASVLSSSPDIICLDEPTTDLDPVGKNQVFQIADILRDRKMTMVIAEHETEETLYADKIIILKNGEIAKEGTPEEVLTDTDFLKNSGIKPLQVTEFFKDYLDEKDRLPLSVEEGLKLWKDLDLSINNEKYQELLNEDKETEDSYGDVLIKVDDLKHTYEGGVEALKGVDLEVRQGEFLAVVGQNGSGKTTLVKHLNGLLLPTNGAVKIKGKDTRKQTLLDISKKVGYVFQNPDHQIFEETVYKEVAFGPGLQGQSEEEIERNTKEALKAVGLDGYEDEDPFSLSKGERQRIAVASILATKPDVIIMDEPTTGLDYNQVLSMMELIKDLNDAGHTIIMVTHTMWVVAEYAHRAVVLNNGEMILNGKIRDVFSQEEILEKAFLKPPQIIQLSNKLGNTIKSEEELKYITKEGNH